MAPLYKRWVVVRVVVGVVVRVAVGVIVRLHKEASRILDQISKIQYFKHLNILTQPNNFQGFRGHSSLVKKQLLEVVVGVVDGMVVGVAAYVHMGTPTITTTTSPSPFHHRHPTTTTATTTTTTTTTPTTTYQHSHPFPPSLHSLSSPPSLPPSVPTSLLPFLPPPPGVYVAGARPAAAAGRFVTDRQLEADAGRFIAMTAD